MSKPPIPPSILTAKSVINSSTEQAKFINKRVEYKNVYKTYRVNEDIVNLIDSLVSDENEKTSWHTWASEPDSKQRSNKRIDIYGYTRQERYK